jgi:hypothetical protein
LSFPASDALARREGREPSASGSEQTKLRQ